MHIVVMGAGGVGCYFGAKLARGGETVTLIARGEHLTAIQRDGLRIRSSVEGESVVRLAAVEDVRGLSAAEVILFCVKSFDTETAAERIRPIVGPDTAVLSLQNGIDNEDTIDEILGPGHVMGSVALAAAAKAGLAPGIVDQTMQTATAIAPGNFSSLYQDLSRSKRLELEALHGHAVRLGERFGVATPAVAAVYAALKPHAAGRRA